ncbi:HAMP domain-containing sensor histidine kinase [Exiguobacterium sp. SRB7LM]|uniref:HAMP domain-containing sensor histidine kinase n=1 Tax=Exiguobacterium sp. SRB7LM TaxID=2608401 RepID=UPI0018C3A4A7|nr:HAMP domain-containing sensor histidine kinase [Exiguobacterium sp. SRB7LM]MBG0918899.1 HAMP domain-containing histidine kinase [Exiguobacterium sp. SRB7LM]
MKRFISTIYGRFLMIFFGLLLIPILLTFTIFLTFQFNALKTQVEEMLVDRANSMQMASQDYGLASDVVLDLFDDATLNAQTMRYDRAEWSISERATLERGEVLSQTDRLPQVAFLLDETVVTLSPNADENPISIFRDVSLQTLFLTALISSVLILFAVRLMTRRIDRVTDAVNRVTAGDLSVRIHDVATDEIGMLAKQFNQMTETLETNETKNEELASVMAHEFKTPVASILGYATLLKRGGPFEKQSEYVTKIEREGKRLSRLSQDVLRLAKLDHTIVGLHATELSLSEQIREAILSLDSEMTRKRMKLDLTMDEVVMKGDATLLQQVWINLLQNAVEYAYEESTLHLLVKEDATHITCEIRDEGEGMTPEQVDRAFERFYQADTSRHRNGSGLGLAIARQIVQLHGGEITLSSEKQIGTTAKVVFPKEDR